MDKRQLLSHNKSNTEFCIVLYLLMEALAAHLKRRNNRLLEDELTLPCIP